MNITKEVFGVVGGREVYKFLLSNSNGIEISITNYGGIIISLRVPDKKAEIADVVLGHESLDEYLKSGSFFGAIVGRYANRIEDAVFDINGIEYCLAQNNGKNHIHGGLKGFDKVVWDAELCSTGEKESLCLHYRSRDGEENYPGNLDVNVNYSLSEDNALEINYVAVSDKDTVVNLTNHSYFNLGGQSSGNVLEHQLMISADKFTSVNPERMPTGEVKDVQGTPLDFRKLTTIGTGLMSEDENIICGAGYDHNWILNVSGKIPEKAAELYDPKGGRIMEVYTTKPGVQFYSGNFLDNNIVGKNKVWYEKWCGVCLETQFFPNALKHKHFPSPILRKGEKYQHTTIFKFSCK